MIGLNFLPSPINGWYCPDDPGEPGTEQKRLSINDIEGRLLSALVRGLDVLEIGTGLGVSAEWMARTAHSVVTVDVDPWVWEHVFPCLTSKIIAFRDTINLTHDYDACFIDGLHTFEQCAADIITARKHVKRGGLIILHDLYIEPVRMALLDSGLRYVHIQTKAGMAVAWNE